MIQFSLKNKVERFHLSARGTYGIYLISGFSAKNTGNFKANLKNLVNNQSVKLNKPALKIRKIYNWKKAIKFYKFTINEPGEYELSFENLQDLKMDKSILIFHKLLFPDSVSLDQIEVRIE